MIDPIINGIVLVIFGLILGAVLQLFGLLSHGFSRLALIRGTPQKQGEKTGKVDLRRFINESHERAELTRQAIRTMPRSVKISLATFYGLIFVLVLFVKYSPIEMKWLIFLGSVFAGFILMDLVFSRAKAGKIRIEGRSFFDVLPDEKNKINPKSNLS